MNQTKEKSKFRIERWRIVSLLYVLFDAFAVNMAYGLVLWLRFDCRYSMIPPGYLEPWMSFIPIYTIFCLIVFTVFKLYRSIWSFASYVELNRICVASLVTSIFHIVAITILFKRMPMTYYILGAVLQFIFIAGSRFAYRFLRLEKQKYYKTPKGELKKVMIIGAGKAGQSLLRDVRRTEGYNDKVVCFIDDDSNKWRRYIDDVEVVGGRESILSEAIKREIDKIYIAIPSASAEKVGQILDICKESGCELKIIPGLYQLANGEVTVNSLKDVDVEDLLGREPIKVDMSEIFHYLTGKVILVTGGGGSIGSELCRQIAAHKPKQLIIFDVYENNAHAIGLELKDKYPELNLEVLIGSVRDSRRINQVFADYKPEVVYHAAAHKHVPLMEDSPCESIKNNAIGTYKTAYAAMQNGCERFVLISTDKAVNPTNIMGASKRLCEMIIQSFDRKIKDGRAGDLPALRVHMEDEMSEVLNIPNGVKPKTEFVAVRFGNVLGSNGSVLIRFKEQIQKGGPVTVTHPDIIRYFMTIPEAVSLVLQAGCYARGGEIFVLDMGAPVKIDSMARNMIKLSGMKPDVDIKIVYTGLRPGEKLYEEKLMAEEGLKKTENKLIYIGLPLPFDTDVFLTQIQELMEAAYEEREDIRDLVAEVVPTFKPAGREGSEDKGAVYEAQVKRMELLKSS